MLFYSRLCINSCWWVCQLVKVALLYSRHSSGLFLGITGRCILALNLPSPADRWLFKRPTFNFRHKLLNAVKSTAPLPALLENITSFRVSASRTRNFARFLVFVSNCLCCLTTWISTYNSPDSSIRVLCNTVLYRMFPKLIPSLTW